MFSLSSNNSCQFYAKWLFYNYIIIDRSLLSFSLKQIRNNFHNKYTFQYKHRMRTARRSTISRGKWPDPAPPPPPSISYPSSLYHTPSPLYHTLSIPHLLPYHTICGQNDRHEWKHYLAKYFVWGGNYTKELFSALLLPT